MLSLPSDVTDPLSLADWLEILALKSADRNSSHGDLYQALKRLDPENVDEICRETMMEVGERARAAGDGYPFDFSGSLLRLKGKWEDHLPYIFCLFLSYCEDKKKKVPGLKHEQMFEQLSCVAVRSYLGGEVLHFGFPRVAPPKGFAGALRNVCGQVSEWNPTSNGTAKIKDGGLDLVAWKCFPDRKIGKLVLFGHCASGRDWPDKINELDPEDFCNTWLSGQKSPVVKTFFIPYRLPAEDFDRRAISAKLFFDRCRIALWASSADFQIKTKAGSVSWCRKMMAAV